MQQGCSSQVRIVPATARCLSAGPTKESFSPSSPLPHKSLTVSQRAFCCLHGVFLLWQTLPRVKEGIQLLRKQTLEWNGRNAFLNARLHRRFSCVTPFNSFLSPSPALLCSWGCRWKSCVHRGRIRYQREPSKRHAAGNRVRRHACRSDGHFQKPVKRLSLCLSPLTLGGAVPPAICTEHPVYSLVNFTPW